MSDHPPRILISACLLGQPVRYDGRGLRIEHGLLARWQERGWLVPICPEVAGGLPTPRPPAEIVRQPGGARVLTATGEDCSEAFERGAQAALALARRMGCRHAVLTERSPSCGSTQVYDGGFAGRLIDGQGLTAALLRRHGVQVFSQHQLDALNDMLLRQWPASYPLPPDETP